MIIADRKPIAEILKAVGSYARVLVAGCKGCVTVCSAGGEKEVATLASLLRLACAKEGISAEFDETTVERQCDKEYVEGLRKAVEKVDAVLSMACGVGPQYIAEVFPNLPAFPAVNTRFIGANVEQGVWSERCQACGSCVLERTGGICPIARCSKSILNGPCGGSSQGKCEINPEVPCAWQLIYDRLKALGQLDRLEEIEPIKDWSASRDGGPRKLVREDLKL